MVRTDITGKIIEELDVSNVLRKATRAFDGGYVMAGMSDMATCLSCVIPKVFAPLSIMPMRRLSRSPRSVRRLRPR